MTILFAEYIRPTPAYDRVWLKYHAIEVVEFNAANSEQKTPTYNFNLRRKLELKCNKRMSSTGFLPVADVDVADMVCGRYGHFLWPI